MYLPAGGGAGPDHLAGSVDAERDGAVTAQRAEVAHHAAFQMNACVWPLAVALAPTT